MHITGIASNPELIEIMVEGEGFADVELIRLPERSTARDIVVAVATKYGSGPEEAFLFAEDCEEPLDLTLIIESGMSDKVHHVHRLRHVDVTVFYQGRHIERRFSPATRVQRVLDWVVSPSGFNIDKTIAPEMELALQGSAKALPKDAHIGRYLRHPQHCLSFDLIRGVIPNGASL
jgi:hypothetical protein